MVWLVTGPISTVYLPSPELLNKLNPEAAW